MYSEILIYIGAGLLFVAGGLLTSKLLRPDNPNREKNSVYESGEEPSGDSRVSFPVRYYVIALLFLLFEVEIIFLFPWALVFSDPELNSTTDGRWGWLALIEMFVFLIILIGGLAYAWKKGFLDWEKPSVTNREYKSPVPRELYEEFNNKIQ